MTHDELIEVIWEAKGKRSATLDLRKKGLTELPPDLFRLPELLVLDLSGNRLTILPPEISRLNKLQKLNLSSNQFVELPPELFELTDLQMLGLGSLGLSVLPSAIGKLTDLPLLYLHQNKLSALPPEIGQLTELRELVLWGNQLVTLPSEINQLENLQHLCLGDNALASLPPEIGQLTKLRKLCLSDNALASLPPEISKLEELNKLDAERNPLVSPPLEIVHNGVQAVQQYLIDLEKGARPLSELKLVVIGDGAVGKTSLIKQLFGKDFDHDEQPTHGVGTLRWDATVSGHQMRINIWDFGGQDITHAQHQLFFSKRSLYVLVLDSRLHDRSEYWLQHIRAFGGDSPVLVVLNKQDRQIGCDLNLPFLREKYPSIRNFFHTSCRTGEGVTEFREGLLAELAKVKTAAVCWPSPWFAVKRRIEQMGRSWISSSEYRAICAEERIMNEKASGMLLEFLHDLGAAVHFKNVCWDAMHVLDTAWAVNAIYGVVTSDKTAQNAGIVHLQDMTEILPEDVCGTTFCPKETHGFILELMKQFELCCELKSETVLIPQLLPASEPDFSFERTGAVRFILHYPDFLPPSIFPRFMVKAHKDIRNQLCWRAGVLLEDSLSGAKALVRQDVQIRRISIWVNGRYRREYLHYLRFLLTSINSSFKKLKVMKIVPISEEEDVCADYLALLEYAKNDIDKYIPAGSTKVYHVRELLKLVQPETVEELALIVEKMNLESEEKSAFIEWLFGVAKILPVQHFIAFNIDELFHAMLAWRQQREQELTWRQQKRRTA
jgi:small GTP-binding protein